jgi:hypothetical protein
MSDENWAVVREAVRERTAEVRMSEDKLRHTVVVFLQSLEAELTRLAETVRVLLVFVEDGRTGDSET